jgi:dTDP-L-rhamnose 4-epimerase
MPLVLVTGGAGFIGSHVALALLRAGFEVRILDNLSPQIHGAVPDGAYWLKGGDVDFVRGSVTSPADVHKALKDVDAIVHLAAETGTGQSMYEIARYSEVNIQGTATLLDAVITTKNHAVRRIVLASSRSIYGEGAYICATCSPERRVYPDARSGEALAKHQWEPTCAHCGSELTPVPTREDAPIRSASIYAATKSVQEDLIRISCSSSGIGYAILRLQNVYGERQSLNNPYTGILSIFSTRIRHGLHLPIFEDGNESRDFVHVEDVANVFATSLRTQIPLNRPINVGGGVKISVLHVAQELSRAFGVSPNCVVTGQYRAGDIRHNYADVSLLKEALGYIPKIDIQRGLQRFVAWAREQPLPEDRLERAHAELGHHKMMGQ